MVMFGPPGRLQSYRSYGIHLCANISCQRAGGRQRAGTGGRRAFFDVIEHDVDAGLRSDLIVDSLRIPAQAVADGRAVRGHLHWSLSDNYEWFKGYDGHFGLLGNDRATQQRRIRPSAVRLGSIARAKGLAD